MRRLVALAPIAVLLALIVVFAGYALHHSPQVATRAMVGKPVPDVALAALDGGGAPAPLRLTVQGPTLINFFASWCAPCAEEAPALGALKDEGVRIIGVAWKDDPAKTRDFLARYGNPYAVVLVDRDGRAGIDFGVSGVPETYAVGPDGRIADKRALPIGAADAEALLRKAGS